MPSIEGLFIWVSVTSFLDSVTAWAVCFGAVRPDGKSGNDPLATPSMFTAASALRGDHHGEPALRRQPMEPQLLRYTQQQTNRNSID